MNKTLRIVLENVLFIFAMSLLVIAWLLVVMWGLRGDGQTTMMGASALILLGVSWNSPRDLELEKLSYLMRQLPAMSKLKILSAALACWVIVKFTALTGWRGNA